jgi:hypothetical protein
MKAILFLILLVALAMNSFAKNAIVNKRCYNLTEYEYYDERKNQYVTKIPSQGEKDFNAKLVINGFGTSRMTAQCPIYSLLFETEVYPLFSKGFGNKSKLIGRTWYYTLGDRGVTILEFYENSSKVKLHNLGGLVYTYVGQLNRTKEKSK